MAGMEAQKSENLHVNSRMLVILMLLVGLVNVVGVIISAISMTKPVKPNVAISQSNPVVSAKYLQDLFTGGLDGSGIGKRSVNNLDKVDSDGNRIWTFAVGHEYGANEYIDTSGALLGFNKMMVAKVCDVMGLKCDVIYDAYQNCWTSEPGRHPRGGEGLLGGWYDACIGWAKTNERDHVFRFSMAYQQAASPKYYSLTRQSNFNPMDVTNKTIGFLEGSYASEKCLSHVMKADYKGYPINPERIIYASDPYSLVQLLKQRRVDAIFSSPDPMAIYENAGEIHQIKGTDYACAKDGYAIMARKDSQIVSLWDQGFRKLRESGDFKTICKNAQTLHSDFGEIKCL